MAKKSIAEMMLERKGDLIGTNIAEDDYVQTEMAGLPAVEESSEPAPAPAPAPSGKKRGRPRKEDTALKTTYVRATITPEYKKKLRIVLAEQGKTEDAFVSELVMKAIDKAYAAIIGG